MIEALAAIQRAGKIRHFGDSNVTVEQLDLARSITPIVSVQNAYNLRDQSSEEVLAACERLGIAFLPWYPRPPPDAVSLASAQLEPPRHPGYLA